MTSIPKEQPRRNDKDAGEWQSFGDLARQIVERMAKAPRSE